MELGQPQYQREKESAHAPRLHAWSRDQLQSRDETRARGQTNGSRRAMRKRAESRERGRERESGESWLTSPGYYPAQQGGDHTDTDNLPVLLIFYLPVPGNESGFASGRNEINLGRGTNLRIIRNKNQKQLPRGGGNLGNYIFKPSLLAAISQTQLHSKTAS